MTYPNGRKIDYVYNTGLDATISRLSAQADDNAGSPGTTLEAYVYLGLNTIVERDHPEPNVNLTYIQQTGQTNTLTDGGDIYTGLDRFGRVIDQNWWNPSTTSSTDRFQYAYDRASQVLYKNNLVAPAESELYHASSTSSGDNNSAYDLVGRLTGFARGTLSASGNNGSVLDTVASSSRSQSWSLDALGNWSSQTTNGSTTTRGFNAQNETTSVSVGTAPGYDSNGNTTSDAGQTMVYDAWNRLVGVKSGSVLVAAYAYDALTRRVSETYSGTATTNHLYYSSQWQVIEERQNGTTASNVSFQYVWGAAYIDQMVLRDSYSSGNRTLRLYVQQDANFNVTALVSASGVVQERYLYDPYGSVTITDSSYTARSSSSYGWIYLNQGGRQDAVTGWYLFRFRDYIPGEGRWAERDPLGYLPTGLNLYRYNKNNPESLTDSSGMMEDPATTSVCAASGPITPWSKLGPGDLVIISANSPAAGTKPEDHIGSTRWKDFEYWSTKNRYTLAPVTPSNRDQLKKAIDDLTRIKGPFRRILIISHAGGGVDAPRLTLSDKKSSKDNPSEIYITSRPGQDSTLDIGLATSINNGLLPGGILVLGSCGYYEYVSIYSKERQTPQYQLEWEMNLTIWAFMIEHDVYAMTEKMEPNAEGAGFNTPGVVKGATINGPINDD